MKTRRSTGHPTARAWLSTTALVLATAACAAGPAGDPATPSTAATSTDSTPSTGSPADGALPVVLPSAADVVDQAIAALNADKFDCKRMEGEKGVGACDVEKEGVPSLVLVYGVPVLFVLSHFLRKPDVKCEQILPKLNEINGAVDRLKVVCIDNRVTFMTALLVPTNGLAPRDIQEGATWFRQSVQMVLGTSGLVEALQ
jgi:hypothetical protein